MKILLQNPNLHINKPFTVFEFNNFLNKENYDLLYNTFPSDKYFEKKELNELRLKGTDYTHDRFSSIDPSFNNFLSENPLWKEFYESLNSEVFVRSAYFFSLIGCIKSRGLRALKIWTTKNKPFFIKKFFRKVKTSMVFSRQKGQQMVFPHTDNNKKLISMIYYLPEKSWKSDSKGGTEFWKNNQNIDRWKNASMIYESTFQDFKNDHTIFHTCKFEKNKLVGFVQSNISWHSVTNTKDTNQSRKSVGIFLRMDL